jgi:hypothetical protein
VHRTIRAVPTERLTEEQVRTRPVPARLPDTDRRLVVRVPQQPYLRVDRNDYSVDPAFAGRRVELHISQAHVTAVVLDTGEVACRHRRSFAGGLTFTDPAHQTQLERLRAQRRQRHEIDVEIRPLERRSARASPASAFSSRPPPNGSPASPTPNATATSRPSCAGCRSSR